MAVRVRIPSPLRTYTGGVDSVDIDGDSDAAVLANLEAGHPGVTEQLREKDGSMRRFIKVYLNGDDIRFLDNLDSAVKDGDEIAIVPALAGG